jgi:GNAT superfamily N-acetyltransferase
MSQTVTTRRATAADLEIALPLLQRFFVEEGFATPPGQIREQLVGLLAEPESAVFLAWLDSRAAGVVTVTTTRGLELGYSAEMEDLYVLPEVRHAGVGSALIQAVKDWCQVQGCGVLYVVVTPEGQAAYDLIGYYAARGFAESGRTILFHHLERGGATPPLRNGDSAV